MCVVVCVCVCVCVFVCLQASLKPVNGHVLLTGRSAVHSGGKDSQMCLSVFPITPSLPSPPRSLSPSLSLCLPSSLSLHLSLDVCLEGKVQQVKWKSRLHFSQCFIPPLLSVPHYFFSILISSHSIVFSNLIHLTTDSLETCLSYFFFFLFSTLAKPGISTSSRHNFEFLSCIDSRVVCAHNYSLVLAGVV